MSHSSEGTMVLEVEVADKRAVMLSTWIENGYRVYSISTTSGFVKCFVESDHIPRHKTWKFALECYRAHSRPPISH
jgi:hypothetical protein